MLELATNISTCRSTNEFLRMSAWLSNNYGNQSMKVPPKRKIGIREKQSNKYTVLRENIQRSKPLKRKKGIGLHRLPPSTFSSVLIPAQSQIRADSTTHQFNKTKSTFDLRPLSELSLVEPMRTVFYTR